MCQAVRTLYAVLDLEGALNPRTQKTLFGSLFFEAQLVFGYLFFQRAKVPLSGNIIANYGLPLVASRKQKIPSKTSGSPNILNEYFQK